MPETDGGEYLLEALTEAGVFRMNDNGGPSPLLWTDLEAYARLTDTLDEPFEARAVMGLSKAYVEGYYIGLQSNGIPPFDGWNPIAAEWFNG